MSKKYRYLLDILITKDPSSKDWDDAKQKLDCFVMGLIAKSCE